MISNQIKSKSNQTLVVVTEYKHPQCDGCDLIFDLWVGNEIWFEIRPSLGNTYDTQRAIKCDLLEKRILSFLRKENYITNLWF